MLLGLASTSMSALLELILAFLLLKHVPTVLVHLRAPVLADMSEMGLDLASTLMSAPEELIHVTMLLKFATITRGLSHALAP